MKFSLILATIDRTNEVSAFFRSLSRQEHQDFEVIVADQNKDDRVVQVLKEFGSQMSIRHIRSAPGLSRSRNAALRHATGDIVAFPDDDCVYPPQMLMKINSFFVGHDRVDGLLIRMKNLLNNGLEVLEGVPSKMIDKKDVFSTASISIFIRKNVVAAVKEFDEQMGLGAGTIFRGGEDYEFILRAMQEGKTFYYENSIEVLHPITNPFGKEGVNKNNLSLFRRRISDAGTSDYLLLKRYFSGGYRRRILLNNILGIFFYGLKFDKRQAELHYFRSKGMLRAIGHLGI